MTWVYIGVAFLLGYAIGGRATENRLVAAADRRMDYEDRARSRGKP